MTLSEQLQQARPPRPIVPFDRLNDRLLEMDFTLANREITADVLATTADFSEYIAETLRKGNARYGVGGYDEYREVYSRSTVFDPAVPGDEPRRLHLGIDIWGPAGTEIYAPLEGVVHSFAVNDHFGDYGATIILAHELDGLRFHSLYGHLALSDLNKRYEGMPVSAGQALAHMGYPHENGQWPPHLHFQLIIDMEGKKGDYPGVCKLNERNKYLQNCPNGK